MAAITVEKFGKKRVAKFFLSENDPPDAPMCEGEGRTFQEALSNLGEEMDAVYDSLP